MMGWNNEIFYQTAHKDIHTQSIISLNDSSYHSNHDILLFYG